MNPRLFWDKVKVLGENDCWEWQGSLFQGTGYGQFSAGPRNGLYPSAHRTAYALTHGVISLGLVVMHKCDNKLCCNPTHLSLGSQKENLQDMVNKGRQAKGEKSNHLGNARLTRYQILSIRSDKRHCKLVAPEYGITHQHARRIQRGLHWGEIS